MTDINAKLEYYAVVNNMNWPEMQDWCMENVGEFNVDWYKLGVDPAASLMGDNRTHWYFKDQQKMILFTLRWS